MATRVSRSKSPKRRSASPKRKSMSPKRKTMRKRSMSKKAASPKRKRSMSKKAASPKRKRSMSKKAASKRRLARKSRSPRKTAGKSGYANFRKMNFKKMMKNPEFAAMTPRARFAAVAAAVALMWKKASAKTKSAVKKMVRSPRKIRKMRMSKKRAAKKSGSPRKTRKDKGAKRSGRAPSEWVKFYAKYQAAKRAALGTNNQRMVMKALAADYRAGVRSY